MCFPEQWRSWIRSCVMSAYASILINGSPTAPFKLQWGLRQGDPLSPFLFDIAVEPLSIILQKAVALQLWKGIEVCRNGSGISHLQYADDIILLCPPNIEYLLNIKKAVIMFQLASGLQVNFHKSSIMGININPQWLQNVSQTLLCKSGTLPFTYLGLPIGGNTARINAWDPIIERMSRKLETWKGSLLSIGGRLTLLKATLSSLPLYYMSLFPILVGVVEKIIKLQRQFLWSGNSANKKLVPVPWSLIERPKSMGGV